MGTEIVYILVKLFEWRRYIFGILNRNDRFAELVPRLR